MTQNKIVLFISGYNDKCTATVSVDKNGKRFTVFDGGTNVVRFLTPKTFTARTAVLMPGQKSVLRLERPLVIFNEIASPETHRITLANAQQIISQFQHATVINLPRNILNTSRDRVYQLIRGLPGVSCPKAVCVNPATRDELRALVEANFGSAEVIVREAGTHGGDTMRRWSAEQADSLLDVFPIDGRSLYIIEFRDFKSGDGLYRKYRVAVVDGVPYIRHLIIAENWLIHSRSRNFMRQRPELISEEQALLENFEQRLLPVLLEPVKAIQQALGLDYFGIDFSLDHEKNLVIFEANSNMNMLINSEPPPNIWVAPIGRVVTAINKLVEDKLTHAELR